LGLLLGSRWHGDRRRRPIRYWPVPPLSHPRSDAVRGHLRKGACWWSPCHYFSCLASRVSTEAVMNDGLFGSRRVLAGGHFPLHDNSARPAAHPVAAVLLGWRLVVVCSDRALSQCSAVSRDSELRRRNLIAAGVERDGTRFPQRRGAFVESCAPF